MVLKTMGMLRRITSISAVCLSCCAGVPSLVNASEVQAAAAAAQSPSIARQVGTIKAISGNTITLTTDAGSEATILVQDSAKLVRIAPGQKDLKDAAAIALADLQTGDRILVRGTLAPDGKSILAVSVIAMKKGDISEKQAREREEWQRHGAGGLVSNVDTANNAITVSLPVIGEKKTVIIRLSSATILRRYAPDSMKFDDAKVAPLDQIKPGDQLRARGSRNADGSEVTADEIVTGTFRNIAGTISSLDASASNLTVQDLATRKSVTIKITTDSQLRKLPLPMAQRIAARLKGTPADASTPAASAGTAGSNAVQPARADSAQSNGSGAGSGAPGGQGRPGGGGAPDLQQAIIRMPAATLADLKKGDAVMIVATEGGPGGMPTAITLLSGVEPILEASPKSSAGTILSPWSLASTPGGEATAQ